MKRLISILLAIVLVFSIAVIYFFMHRKNKITERQISIKVVSDDNPNIILITVDTLRPDHLGCYGYKRNTSPNLDSLADQSVLFEKCFSHAPSTAMSCSSILTGFLPHETKLLDNFNPMSLNLNTLPEILKQAGYSTYGIVSNYVLRKGQNFEQGFDIYNDTMIQTEINRKIEERIAPDTTSCAIEILKKSSNKFFMWIHYQDPHGPYTPPSPFNKEFVQKDLEPLRLKIYDKSLGRRTPTDGRDAIPSYQKLGDHDDVNYYIAQYDGEIRYFDEHFGKLIGALKECDLYENTFIIFTADHGEAMGESGYYFDHGDNLDNCMIHVPLIIKHSKVNPGIRDDYVQHVDIVPTILAAAGIKTDVAFRGCDILRSRQELRAIYSEMPPTLNGDSIIIGGLKLIRYGGKLRLFDLNQSISEVNNLAENDNYRHLLADMEGILISLQKEDLINIDVGESKTKLTDENIEILRSLGYVQ